MRDGGEGSEQEGGRHTVQKREMQAYSFAEGNANAHFDKKLYSVRSLIKVIVTLNRFVVPCRSYFDPFKNSSQCSFNYVHAGFSQK